MKNRKAKAMSEKFADVESLLAREQRARLSLPLQLLLYLAPFALFKDVSTGTAQARERALSYNCAMRWMLLAYVRRWSVIATSLFVAFVPTEALAADARIFLISAAAFAVGANIAVAVTVLTLAVYLLLGSKRE